MSEFKFACPVCGQHIKCESDKTGTSMECPTCFKKIIVPQAPATESSKFILTASQPSSRPMSQVGAPGDAVQDRGSSSRRFWFAAFLLVLVAGAAGAGFYFLHGQRSNTAPDDAEDETNAPGGALPSAGVAATPRPADDTNWTLNLEGLAIPETPAAGWINGRSFNCKLATLRGGTLELRQGLDGPIEAGVTIRLFAKRGEDLANQSIGITTDRAVAPRVQLRWSDDLGQNQALTFNGGYALRLEFGKVATNRIPVRIYLCTPDDLKSYVVGMFQAQIRNPPPPRPRPPRNPPAKRP